MRIATLLFSMIPAFALGQAEEPARRWVSTVGTNIPLAVTAHAAPDFLCWRIGTPAERDRARELLRDFLGTPAGSEHPLLRVWFHGLMVRNYDREVCYVVVSPPTIDRELYQPYVLDGTSELRFEYRPMSEKGGGEHRSVRLYVVARTEDRYAKVLLVGGDVRPLEPRAPE